MKTLSKFVTTSAASLLVITSPVLISSTIKKADVFTSTTAVAAAYNIPVLTNTAKHISYTSSLSVSAVTKNVTAVERKVDYDVSYEAKKAFEVKMVIKQALSLYDSMDLGKTGLNQKAFEYAWRGYHNLVKNDELDRTGTLTIVDFTQSSKNKRMYVIDVDHKKLLFNTYVSHGMNSGVEYATSFSNRAESFKSSLGFFKTSKTYFGRNGLSLKIMGLDKGYNDAATKRHIVLHGSDYMNQEYLDQNGEMGRSLGCAAMPTTISPKIIKTIKNGTCLFVYHPTIKYLNNSNVIND